MLVASPYAGDVERNLAYARRCLRDALSRGEAPFASHLLYPHPLVLDDYDPRERALGINAEHAFLIICNRVCVYQDHGITPGMRAAIVCAETHNIPVAYRSIGVQDV